VARGFETPQIGRVDFGLPRLAHGSPSILITPKFYRLVDRLSIVVYGRPG
jgi:hypothetical protein